VSWGHCWLRWACFTAQEPCCVGPSALPHIVTSLSFALATSSLEAQEKRQQRSPSPAISSSKALNLFLSPEAMAAKKKDRYALIPRSIQPRISVMRPCCWPQSHHAGLDAHDLRLFALQVRKAHISFSMMAFRIQPSHRT